MYGMAKDYILSFAIIHFLEINYLKKRCFFLLEYDILYLSKRKGEWEQGNGYLSPKYQMKPIVAIIRKAKRWKVNLFQLFGRK